ncbi:equilibrative nucleoside transporter 1-like [Artemia franciscana]|uniref:Equilibrative nucleoside transporter n=1 Tax=Artemia franciscana TaxID=6661 RepID=A0AA88HAG9_ARTSF|nr:hypothetical protein QYM36_015526 [Artemia franciscana]
MSEESSRRRAATSRTQQELLSQPVLVDESQPLLQPYLPRDNNNFVYVAFYLLGMATLLPWNFFITINSYWLYKFRDLNNSHYHYGMPKSSLQATFEADLCVTATIPSMIVLFVHGFYGYKVPGKIRIIGGITSVIIIFIVTTALVKINTDPWQDKFFIVTLISVALMNGLGAIFQGGLIGLVGKFPPRYMGAVLGGQGLAGLFAASADIVSIALEADPTQSAFLYFLVADITLVAALISYISISQTTFFKYYEIPHGKRPKLEPYMESAKISSSSSSEGIENASGHEITPGSSKVSYRHIFKKTWMYCVSIWLVFFVTLSIFPSLAVLVEPIQIARGGAWNQVYFTPVACFLLFNFLDYISRPISSVLLWPKMGSKLILVFAIARFLLIPGVMLCNAQPRKYLPVFFENDFAFILIVALLAASNGYLSTLCFIYAPKRVFSEEQEVAASLLTSALSIGITLGTAASSLWVRLL